MLCIVATHLHNTYINFTEKPDLHTLLCLPSHGGRNIKIIESSASHYYHIGIILLNDRHGNRVAAIERSLNGRVMDIMLEVYRQWLTEDINCFWTTLTNCFRQCDLNNLAHSIEQHFGLPSPTVPSLQYTLVSSPHKTSVSTLQHTSDSQTSDHSCGVPSKTVYSLLYLYTYSLIFYSTIKPCVTQFMMSSKI